MNHPQVSHRLAIHMLLPAILGVAGFMPGATARADSIFDVAAYTVDRGFGPTHVGDAEVIYLVVTVDMSPDWTLLDFRIHGPTNERGQFPETDGRYDDLPFADLYDTRSSDQSAGEWFDLLVVPGAGGHFTGSVEVTATRGWPNEPVTKTIDFEFTKTFGDANAVPEPAAAVSAVIAALGGVALAATRRRRRAG